MKAKITERFTITYQGEKLCYDKGTTVEGWPAKRAVAAGKAVPLSAIAAPETKVSLPDETK